MAPAPWFPPIPPVTCSFWNATNVQGFLKELHNTLDLEEAIPIQSKLFNSSMSLIYFI
uniref:Uncharacterized protein n=1 Tax=Helianthus annuus TaxID=4232 RepID=A0A251V098_HELAN